MVSVIFPVHTRTYHRLCFVHWRLAGASGRCTNRGNTRRQRSKSSRRASKALGQAAHGAAKGVCVCVCGCVCESKLCLCLSVPMLVSVSVRVCKWLLLHVCAGVFVYVPLAVCVCACACACACVCVRGM